MNVRNIVQQIGRIPTTEKIPFKYFEKDDPTKSFITFMISVRRNYKPKDAQYYEEDLIPVKAFGYKAKYIHENAKRGDTVTVAGDLRRDPDWEDNEGNTRRGELCIYAEDVFCHNSNNRSTDGNDSDGAATPKKTSGGSSALKNRLRNRRVG